MQPIETDIPARLDRLPWSRFHLLIVVALGITWVLDGLEVTIVGSIGPMLQDRRTLGLSAQQISTMASAYVAGAVVGALFFGWLTDRYGRRLVFNITLGLYVIGVLASACAWSFWSIMAFRVVTGLGIGGEYAAINSAIDELIPAKLRGRIDLIVNGSYWGRCRAGGRRPRCCCWAVGHRVAATGLAAGLRHRRGAGSGRAGAAALRAGKPALAGHARPQRGGESARWPRWSSGCARARRRRPWVRRRAS